MLKVGLTGNIGSGKTMVASIFSSLGVPVFHADNEARKQFENEKVKEKIRGIFGLGVFSADGEVMRTELAEIVFINQSLLEKLNRIIHPEVRKEYHEWCFKNSETPYTLYEAAILFESGHFREMDKVICVTAPEETRIMRVMQRDHITREDVEKRMANQWQEYKKVELSDFVIRNNEGNMVITQVLEVHKKIIQNLKLKIKN